MSVKKALEKYSRKAMGVKREKKDKPKKVSGRAPEKQVEQEILQWCKKRGFDVSVVESKAVYSRSAGRYLRGQTEAGFSDLVGVDANGRAVFIELKAVGKRKTLKPHQYDFLLRKIRLGAFACCTDSVHHINELYSIFNNLLNNCDNTELAKQHLADDLPKNKLICEVFDEPLPW